MKKIITLVCLLFLAGTAWAVSLIGSGIGGEADCSGCSTVNDSIIDHYTSGIQNDSKTEWRAVQFIISSTKCITMVTAEGYRLSGLTSVTWEIQTDNAGEPSGTLAHTDLIDTILYDDLPSIYGASDAEWEFQSTVTLGAGTYWLIIKPNGGSWRLFYTYDTGNTPDSDHTYLYSTDSGSNWTDETINRAMDWRLYGCDPS